MAEQICGRARPLLLTYRAEERIDGEKRSVMKRVNESHKKTAGSFRIGHPTDLLTPRGLHSTAPPTWGFPGN